MKSWKKLNKFNIKKNFNMTQNLFLFPLHFLLLLLFCNFISSTLFASSGSLSPRGYADSTSNLSVNNLNIWPQEEFYLISSQATVEQKERTRQLLSSLQSSHNHNFIFLLPSSFLIKPANTNLALREFTQHILNEISRSTIGRVLVKNTKFSIENVIYIFTNENYLPVDSWSSPSTNQTFILVNRDRLNLRFFLSALSHELAIRSDGKAAEIESIFNSLEADRSLNLLKEAVLRNSAIQTAFSAIRAFATERRIMSEIEQPQPYGNPPKDTCYKTLERTIVQVLDQKKSSLWSDPTAPSDYQYVAWLKQRLDELNMTSEKKLQTFLTLTSIEHIAKMTTLKLPRTGESLCDFLSKENLTGPHRSLISSGPRPNIGSGSGVNPQSLNYLNETYQKQIFDNYSFFKNNSRIVHTEFKNLLEGRSDIITPSVPLEDVLRHLEQGAQ